MGQGFMSEMHSQFLITPPYPTTTFNGQTIIVTGSNVGLGLEAARHFVRLGATKVILAVRSLERGQATKTSIDTTEQCGPNVVEVWSLDLASYASVKAFAARAASLPRLDAVVENAAVATYDLELAEENESTITVNVVSTMLLAVMLIPVLRKSGESFGTVPRLTIVSSGIHNWIKFPEWEADNTFEFLSNKATAKMNDRYAASKLLEVFAVRELAKIVPASAVIINMLSPGLCHSELGRNAGWGLWLMKQLMARTTEVGSRTLVHAAGAGSETHGKYLDDSKVMEERMSPFVRSEEGEKAQRKVWKELVGKLEKIQPGVMKSL